MKNTLRILAAVLMLLMVLVQASPAQADPPPDGDWPVPGISTDGAIGTGD